jgi:glycosyltransferase involved in cell wall biosynthesis
MKIGVMMTVYNGAAFVQSALESLLRQRSGEFAMDVVVLNDGSTDATRDIVLGIGAPEIRLIDTPNQGLAKARNAALRHMAEDTDLFTSLDADDLFPSGRLARDAGYFAADPELQIAYGFAEHFRHSSPDGLAPASDSKTVKVRGVSLGSGTYRYSLVRANGLFDENIGSADDTDWLLRMFERGPRYKLVDDVSLYYRRHDSNMTNNTAEVRRAFMHALLKSAKRRQEQGLGPVPAEIFDASALKNGPPL